MENNEQEITKKSINPLVFMAIVVLVGAVLTFIFLKNTNKIEEVSGISVKQTEVMKISQILTENKNKQNDSEIKIIEIEAGSFYYKPNEIRVKKGEKVKIVLKSVSIIHDFNIDEINVRVPIVKSGDTSTIEFVADRVGSFKYYCSVGQHRQMGQIGKFIVE